MVRLVRCLCSSCLSFCCWAATKNGFVHLVCLDVKKGYTWYAWSQNQVYLVRLGSYWVSKTGTPGTFGVENGCTWYVWMSKTGTPGMLGAKTRYTRGTFGCQKMGTALEESSRIHTQPTSYHAIGPRTHRPCFWKDDDPGYIYNELYLGGFNRCWV